MNITVFVFAYPVLSETFVINELYQLQQIGVTGTIWREKNGDGKTHPKARLLKLPVFTLPHKILGRALFALMADHFWWATNHPLRYLKLLVEVLRFFPDAESLKIFVKAVLSARRVAEQHSELVYVHESDRSFVFGLCAARLCDLPLVIIFHTYYLFVEKRYVEHKVRLSSAVFLQSDYSRSVIAETVHDDKQLLSKCHVISSPGIDTEFFSPIKLSISGKRSFASRAANPVLRVVSVGRLEEAKGFEYLLRAIALVKKTPVSCQIIGEGSYRERLQLLISELHLENKVKLLGSISHTEALQDKLRTADVFVLPSIQDSEGVHDVHPNAVKEAMSAGLIVITTRLGGIDEFISHGENGLLIDQADPDLIASAIEHIAQLSDCERARIESNARVTIVENYGADEITNKLLHLLKTHVK